MVGKHYNTRRKAALRAGPFAPLVRELATQLEGWSTIRHCLSDRSEHIQSESCNSIAFLTSVQHGLLPECRNRIIFAVSVFHAYGHQWACQLVYHPRKCVGFGLTDGEGCERFWSEIRRLIPCLRVSGVRKYQGCPTLRSACFGPTVFPSFLRLGLAGCIYPRPVSCFSRKVVEQALQGYARQTLGCSTVLASMPYCS